MMAISLTSPPAPSFSPSPSPSPSSWQYSSCRFFSAERSVVEDMVNHKLHTAAADDRSSNDDGDDGQVVDKAPSVTAGYRLRNRPAKLVLPQFHHPALESEKTKAEMAVIKEFEVEEREYCLASRKGRRDVMEDSNSILLNVLGDPKQAFFAVIDGHGGRAAADHAGEHLGKNIIKELDQLVAGAGEYEIKAAIHEGYLATDKEFLRQGVNGGACAAGVLVRDGRVYAANVGDCRVVVGRNGVAYGLTMDHRLSREDERSRIESSGGYVFCKNGVWRVNGSLAVSRAIGDRYLKEWVIAKPEIQMLSLTADCQLLILASDGLWEKVNEQEAVDAVLDNGKNSVESCKKLVEMSRSRGNTDDITVMVVDLQQFMIN
ncbi:probable protein phosphatase 2C 74 [Diospyros lotus]|uniref:probable protein phosphatase 2C 74 n=1 Tax=Diospyros lotus TaxID=55363 RepID=UPI0022515418|nr:probable protein phosphatase 2C 74 [Diospyros lotus]